MDDIFQGPRGSIHTKRLVSNHFWGQRGSSVSIGKHLWWQVDFGRSATRCTGMGKKCPRRSRARSSKVTDRSDQVPPHGASSAHARNGKISDARRDSAIARPARGSAYGHGHVLRDWKCGLASPKEIGDGDHGEKRPPGENRGVGRPHQRKAGAVDFVPH